MKEDNTNMEKNTNESGQIKKSFLDFNFSPKKMSPSGALYDLMKLDDISKNMISKMTKEELIDQLED